MPLPIWIPLGALIISVSAFLLLLYLSWERAPDGQTFHPRLGWGAQVALYFIFGSVVALLLGFWWTLR